MWMVYCLNHLHLTFDYDFSQRHILVVSDNCTVNNEIKVVFTSERTSRWFQRNVLQLGVKK